MWKIVVYRIQRKENLVCKYWRMIGGYDWYRKCVNTYYPPILFRYHLHIILDRLGIARLEYKPGGGDTAHTLLIGVGWGHRTTLKLGGRVGSVLAENNTTSWLHLASWNLQDSQLSWESKMEPECGNKTKKMMNFQNFKKAYHCHTRASSCILS